MSGTQPKKLNLALYLDPVTSDADRAAMGALQQWYESTKASHSDHDDVDMASVVRVFHRDVYLAGLRLYLINAGFCHQVANGMAQDRFTAEMLVQQIRACGLVPPVENLAGAQPAGFSAAQLDQLKELLAHQPAPADQFQPVEQIQSPEQFEQQAASGPEEVSNAILSRQLVEQGEQMNLLLAEIQQLRSLAEQQSLQLQRLKLGAAAPAAETSRSKQTEEMSVADMGPQLEQMQKIRKKGVF